MSTLAPAPDIVYVIILLYNYAEIIECMCNALNINVLL